MKKVFVSAMLVLLLIFAVSSEEKVLFDSAVQANLDNYDWVSNFEMVSESGYFQKDQFKILPPNEKGIRFLAMDPPKDVSTNYKILTAYPSFLNEEGIGAGYIYNVKFIKSIKIEATTNRPYDEVYLLYKTSPKGDVKKIKMPQNTSTIQSMVDYELLFENPCYEPDPTKRDLRNSPVLGSDADGLYLVGFQIKTNAPCGYNTYSNYSLFYLRKVTVIYDKMFTDEQVETNKILKEEFNIFPDEELEEKARTKIAEKIRIQEVEKSLMNSEDSGVPEDSQAK